MARTKGQLISPIGILTAIGAAVVVDLDISIVLMLLAVQLVHIKMLQTEDLQDLQVMDLQELLLKQYNKNRLEKLTVLN
jgi:hypothetical protein